MSKEFCVWGRNAQYIISIPDIDGGTSAKTLLTHEKGDKTGEGGGGFIFFGIGGKKVNTVTFPRLDALVFGIFQSRR